MQDGLTDIEPGMTEGAPGLERRMVLRVLHRWREVSGEHAMPLIGDVSAEAFREFWPYCFVLDFTRGEENPVFLEFGEELEEICGRNMARRPAKETPAPTVMSESFRYCYEELRKKVPVTRGGELRQGNGTLVLYRSVLLPITTGGEDVTHILGAANCRVAATGSAE